MKRFILLASAFAMMGGALAGCDDGEVEYVDRPVEVPVEDSRPTAAISVGAGPYETGASISFDGSGSEISTDGATYEWDFSLADGISTDATGETVSNTYDEAGEYTVTLTVTDDDGELDSTVVYVEVTEAPDEEAPVAEAGDDRAAALYSTITFDGSASTDNEGITSYSWDFDTANGISEDATGVTVTNSYAIEETFTVRLTVEDAAGNTDFDEFDVTVGPDEEAPEVSIPETYDTQARSFVTFDASSATDNVGIASYSWDVDGEAPAEGSSALLRHSFSEEGTFNGTLTVTDFAGNATTEDFTVSVTPAEPQSLFARPDLVELQEVGATQDVELAFRYPDGSTEAPESFLLNANDLGFVTASNDGDGQFTIEADGNGYGVITAEAGDLSVDIDVRVGGDVIVTTGLEHPNYPSERYFDVATESGVISEISDWTAGLTPVDAETFGSRGYILNSGAPDGENASLLSFNRETLELLAVCDLGGQGAYAVAERTPTEVYVAGVGAPEEVTDEPTDSALVKVNPSDCSVERVFSPTGDQAVNGMKRGSDLDIFGETLIITDSGVTESYSYDTPSLRLFDLASGSQRSVSLLPEGCLNASWSAISGDQLITGCTGDYSDPGAVVVTNLSTFETEDIIPLSAGSPASWTFEPFTGYVFMGSGLSPYVGVVDVYGGTELQSVDDNGIFMDVAPDDASYVNSEAILGIHALNPETIVAVSFTLDRIYGFDPLAAPGLERVQSFARVTPDLGGRGAQLLSEQGIFREPIVLSEQNAEVTAAGEGADEANIAGIYGPPAGGGNFAPNGDPTKLTTLPVAGYIEIQLRGVEVVDEPGSDFVIYENPFYAAGDFFSRAIDPATVQVSPDGDTWYDYPVVENFAYTVGAFTSDARHFVSGFVGVNAVYANPENNDIPIGSSASGGDHFDLSAVGLSSIAAIRIVDVPADAKTANIDAVALTHWRSN
jgi:PKD repeat protein